MLMNHPLLNPIAFACIIAGYFKYFSQNCWGAWQIAQIKKE